MKRRSTGPGVSFFAFQDIITAVVGIFILITLILVLELTQRVEAATSPPTANVEEIESTIESLRQETERLSKEHERRLTQQAGSTEINNFNRDAKTEELTSSVQAATEHLATLKAQIAQTAKSLKQESLKKSKLLQESQQLEGQRDKISELGQKLVEIERVIDRLKTEDGLIYRDKTSEGRSLCLLSLRGTGLELKDAETESVRRFSTQEFERWLGQSISNSRHFLLFVHPSGVGDFDEIRDQLAGHSCIYGFDLVGEDHSVQLGFEWEVEP